ncbi:DUF2490 domain-containing protein [Methylomonas koyamae]|uniref:DUF2490 domain-containing protein n=1 Tax=Methylomonas koyamae TaxID=702114 RepID=UPI0009EF09D3|nr:DUF2490 domain-containing protein [Methylomonas koyamae]
MKRIFYSGKVLKILLLVFAAAGTSAHAGELAEDTGAWLQIVGEGSLKSVDPSLAKGRVWLEGQSRFDGNWGHWYQGMVRSAVGYSLSDRATIWAGYTWLPTQNIGKPYIAQQDIWPAFRYILPTEIGTFTFRTMWETNFLRGDQVRERPRQMIKFMHPFDFEPRLSFIAWDEAFYRVNTTAWGGKSGFDQNRAFSGFGWNFNKNVRAELGYLNQYLDDANHRDAKMHHLGMASLFVNF